MAIIPHQRSSPGAGAPPESRPLGQIGSLSSENKQQGRGRNSLHAGPNNASTTATEALVPTHPESALFIARPWSGLARSAVSRVSMRFDLLLLAERCAPPRWNSATRCRKARWYVSCFRNKDLLWIVKAGQTYGE